MARPTLVTGAAGFAGGHLLDLLAADSDDLVAWHRPGGRPPRDVPGVRWEGVDLRDRQAVQTAIHRAMPARVYHCAGAAHVGEAWNAGAHALEVNVRGTHHIVEALREEAPDARILIPSSGMVYAPSDHPMAEDQPRVPGSPYGLSKLAQEMVSEQNTGGPLVFIARPFNHFGPRQSSSFATAAFARRIAEAEAGLAALEIQVGNLEPRRDLCDVRDTVRAYRAILERGRPGRPYNVCSGQGTQIRVLLDTLLAHARARIRVVVDPARYRPNDLPNVVGNPSRIRDELGWSPEIPLEQTVQDVLEYWRANTRRP
jgi:GDP-4-dehydro-6-deoxy-D-mannose reductase